MLNTFGISTNFNIGTGLDKSIRARLYDREDFARVRKNDGKGRFEAYKYGPWPGESDPASGCRVPETATSSSNQRETAGASPLRSRS